MANLSGRETEEMRSRVDTYPLAKLILRLIEIDFNLNHGTAMRGDREEHSYLCHKINSFQDLVLEHFL